MQQILDAIVPFIVVIAVIAGIINSIRESVASKSKAAPPAQATRSRAQSEIAAFLSGNPNAERPPAARPSPPSARELVSQMSANRPQPAAIAPAKPKQQKPKKQKNQPTRPVDSESRSSSSTPSGAGVKAHVDSFIGDHVRTRMGRDVDAFVQKDIGERVKSHLGNQSSQPVEMTSSESAVSSNPLLQALRSPEGVRQAILVNEILSRPKALRR